VTTILVIFLRINLPNFGRQLHFRQKNKLHLTKSGGGVKPRSLTEVYAYASQQVTIIFCLCLG